LYVLHQDPTWSECSSHCEVEEIRKDEVEEEIGVNKWRITLMCDRDMTHDPHCIDEWDLWLIMNECVHDPVWEC